MRKTLTWKESNYSDFEGFNEDLLMPSTTIRVKPLKDSKKSMEDIKIRLDKKIRGVCGIINFSIKEKNLHGRYFLKFNFNTEADLANVKKLIPEFENCKPWDELKVEIMESRISAYPQIYRTNSFSTKISV